MTEDEMVGWHQRHNGHEFGQDLGAGDDREVWSTESMGSQRVGNN